MEKDEVEQTGRVSQSVKEPRGRRTAGPAGFEEGTEGQERTFLFLFLLAGRGTHLCRQSHGLSACSSTRGLESWRGQGGMIRDERDKQKQADRS